MVRVVLTVAVLACASPARAQQGPFIEVDVDRNVLTLEEEVAMELTLSGRFDDWTEPSLVGFDVLDRRQSRSIQIIGRRRTERHTLTYRLRPKRTGLLTIGPGTLLRAGKVIARSQPVSIRVQEPVELPPTTAERAQNLARRVSEPLFLQAEIERYRYYVGEPFVMSWVLNFQPDIGVSGVEILTRPKLEGLLTEELLQDDGRSRIHHRTIAGRRVHFVPQSVKLVTGLAPGQVIIDSMSMRVTTGGGFRKTRRYTVRSEPFHLDILPLPTAGRPDAFREGNIGRFTLSGSLRSGDGDEPTSLRVGERVVLETVVSGQGNLVGVKPPVFDVGEAFDLQILPSTADDDIQQDAQGVRGRRVFQVLLTPMRPGLHRTPTVRFGYFDPVEATYRDLSWPGRDIEVTGDAPRPRSAALVGEDIGPVIFAHPARPTRTGSWAGTSLFWLLIAAPALASLWVEVRHLLHMHRSKHAGKHRARAAMGNAKKRLRLAEQAIRGELVSDFYDHASRTLNSYLDERANLPAAGMTHEELRRASVEIGYPAELVDRLITELEHCDFARFAPSSSAEAQMRDTLDRVRLLLSRLGATKPRRRP